MAASLVEVISASSGKSSTVTLALSGAPTSGNLLLIWYKSSVLETPSFTDGSWTLIDENVTSGVSCGLYYKISDGTETSVDVTFSGSGRLGAYAEYTDSAGELSLDVSSDNGGTGTTLTWTSITPDASASLKVAAASSGSNSARTSSPTNGYTERHDAGFGAASSSIYLQDEYTADAEGTASTLSASTTWAAVHASFTPPAAGGVPVCLKTGDA